jgi:hypothetical protein
MRIEDISDSKLKSNYCITIRLFSDNSCILFNLLHLVTAFSKNKLTSDIEE